MQRAQPFDSAPRDQLRRMAEVTLDPIENRLRVSLRCSLQVFERFRCERDLVSHFWPNDSRTVWDDPSASFCPPPLRRSDPGIRASTVERGGTSPTSPNTSALCTVHSALLPRGGCKRQFRHVSERLFQLAEQFRRIEVHRVRDLHELD